MVQGSSVGTVAALDKLGQTNKYDLIERYNYISLVDPKKPLPPNIYHFKQQYMTNICADDQGRIRYALHVVSFDYRRNGSKVRTRKSFKPKAIPEAFAKEMGETYEYSKEKLQEILDIHKQKLSKVPEERKLMPCNPIVLNTTLFTQWFIFFFVIFNFLQAAKGFYNMEVREIYLERPGMANYFMCHGLFTIYDWYWEVPNYVYHIPYTMCFLWVRNKYTAYLSVGYPISQWFFLMFRMYRDFYHLMWVVYHDEDWVHVLRHEFAPGIGYDFFFSFLLVTWFYEIHDNKMLFMREMKQSLRREINRELDAKYLNRVKLRRKVTRQSGRIQKGRVIRRLLKLKTRNILKPREWELFLPFAEGMNRFRVLCGAEWLRMLDIPQGYTVENQNDVPFVPPAATPPPEPDDRRHSWSDMWRPKYKYLPPLAPPIIVPPHDIVNYVFDKPRFAKYRDNLLLVYKSEDWLKSKRQSIKLEWSTGSFAWDRKNKD